MPSVNLESNHSAAVRVLRDLTIWGLAVMGIAFSVAAVMFSRADAEFLEQAEEVDAVVIEKNVRSGDAGSSDSLSVRYEWTNATANPPRTHRGAGAYSGGEAAFDALVPGESTVRVAWRTTDDGTTIESRLVEDGFTGMPWSLLFVGLGMLIAVPIRALILYRAEPGVVK